MEKNRCLYCYKELGDGQRDFHPSCIRKFFGTSEAPVMPYTRDNMHELAQKVIRTSTSVTGVQAKMSLDIDRGEKNEPSRFTVVGLWGKYIFKPESPKYRELPQLEDLTMKLADIARIKTVPHSLIKLADGEFGYLTKRVDRASDGKPLSMLDMCQLSNRLTEHKYDGTYVQLADVVRKYSKTPLLDVQRFWEIVIFSWITGNSDMHCKNFSLIDEKGAGEYRLAPAYDLLSVLLADRNDTDEMAMTFEVGGKKNGFVRETFINAMKESGVEEKVASKMIARLCANESAWLKTIDSSFLSENLKKEYKNLIRSRLVRLGEF